MISPVLEYVLVNEKLCLYFIYRKNILRFLDAERDVSVVKSSFKPGDDHMIAMSHGEGRFVCDDKTLSELIENGQVALQYADYDNKPTMDSRFNINNSFLNNSALKTLLPI